MSTGNKEIALARDRKLPLRIMACVGVFFALFVLFFFYAFSLREDVTVSVSPDGSQRIVVRQPRLILLDRNFDVILTDERTGIERIIFESYDQSSLVEKEYFVWTSDSENVALVGDRYFVVPGSELPNGLIVFLVYEVGNHNLFCNTDHERGLPRISSQDAIKMFGDRITSPPSTQPRTTKARPHSGVTFGVVQRAAALYNQP